MTSECAQCVRVGFFYYIFHQPAKAALPSRFELRPSWFSLCLSVLSIFSKNALTFSLRYFTCIDKPIFFLFLFVPLFKKPEN
jgi:hypothetical protein